MHCVFSFYIDSKKPHVKMTAEEKQITPLDQSKLHILHSHVVIYRKEGNVLFNDALNTFYLRLYGVRHMLEDHSESERGNLLPPHGLLFPTSSKGSFICIIPQTG